MLAGNKKDIKLSALYELDDVMPTPRLLQYETWIMVHLFKNSEANLYPARIAEELGFPEVSVHRSLERLEKQKIVQQQTLGPLKLYKLTDSGNHHVLELTKIPAVVTMYMKLIKDAKLPRGDERRLSSTSTLDEFREEVALRLKGYEFSEDKIKRIARLLRSK